MNPLTTPEVCAMPSTTALEVEKQKWAEVADVLCDALQLMFGWDSHEAWSEWDKSVVDRMRELQEKIYKENRDGRTK